jgi:hypothetical protein
MRAITVVLALLVAMFAPASASAKGLMKVVICGADGCADATSRVGHDDRMLDNSLAEAAPDARAPFYRVKLTVGEGGRAGSRWTVLYVPSLDLLRSEDEATSTVSWSRLTSASRRLFHRAVAGRRPLDAARLPLGGPKTTGALAPEVVPPPAQASVAGDGGLPAAAIVGLALAGALAAGATTRWLVRRPGRGAG